MHPLPHNVAEPFCKTLLSPIYIVYLSKHTWSSYSTEKKIQPVKPGTVWFQELWKNVVYVSVDVGRKHFCCCIIWKTSILPSLIRICEKRYSLRWSAGGILRWSMAFRNLSTRQPAILLQAESSAVLVARFLAGRYGTVRMKGSGRISGDATENTRRRAKRAAKAGISTMRFWTEHYKHIQCAD